MDILHRKHQIATSLDLREIPAQGTKLKFPPSMVIIISPLLVCLCQPTVALSVHHHLQLTINIQIENLQIIWIPVIIEGKQ